MMVDFNTIQNGRLDRFPSEQGPSIKKKKFFYSNPHGSYSRIDFLNVSQQHTHKVLNCKIQNITISDHAPVILTVDLGNEPLFRYWRMNTSILSSESVVKEIK